MAGMNNMSAEIAAADLPQYSDIRLFTVGQGTTSATPLESLQTVSHNWTKASAAALGGKAWNEFSAICWLTGREIHDALDVPVGLISSNWGGTSIQVWMPSKANELCNTGNWSGDRHNAMINPYMVGPMQMAGVLWYQGESNNGQGRYYSTAFPCLIQAWRQLFEQPALWVGFVQVAGYQYGGASRPDPSADLRQGQLAALGLPNVAVATTIDTGDWICVHPPDKQTPSHRLAAAALDQIYGMHQLEVAHAPPLYAGQSILPTSTDSNAAAGGGGGGGVTVRVMLSRPATTTVPLWATASSTLGKPGSVPRNACPVADMPPFHNYADCGYPRLYVRCALFGRNLHSMMPLDPAKMRVTNGIPLG
jgi:sialate O-acetylesterase